MIDCFYIEFFFLSPAVQRSELEKSEGPVGVNGFVCQYVF